MQKSNSGELILSEYFTEAEFTSSFRDRLLEVVGYRLPEKCKEDHEDIVGDALAAAIKNIRQGKFDPKKGSLQSYVFKIASNIIADFISDEKKRRPIQHDPEKAPPPSFIEADRVEKEETREELRNVLRNIPLKYQQVLYMKFYEGLRVREISEKIDLPPRRVSERINYGLKLVAKRYKSKK